MLGGADDDVLARAHLGLGDVETEVGMVVVVAGGVEAVGEVELVVDVLLCRAAGEVAPRPAE